MDALDRMLRRLVQNVLASHPEYLARPFELAELYQVLVPYRLNRRELELETNQDYEQTVMQLLAGERGYLVGDAEMQAALRRELESPNPDTGLFRTYATRQVAFSPEIVRRLEERGIPVPPQSDAARTAPQAAAPPPPHAPAAAEAAPSILVPMNAGITVDPPRGAGPASAPAPGAAARPAAPSSHPAPQETMTASPRSSRTVAGGGDCRYCGGALPDGRDITFCPHCGQNLTIQHCPACSTELEIGWKFCTTCGRGVDARA